MADKLRRSKDVIKKNTTSYLNATTNSQYLLYFEGTPTYITYYQIDSTASLMDVGLEAVNSLIGANTPKKYKKIYEVPVYGINELDVNNELSERGLEAVVNGEFLMLPNSIRPYAGDFFTFEYEGLESHLFRINDVQYDKITPEKYFRCSYALYPYNASDIFDNVNKEYTCIYNESALGTNEGTVEIVENSQLALKEEIQTTIDRVIEKYTSLFYHEDSDTFSCYNDDAFYWSPYLQHFLYETKALTPYKQEIMTEFYINDIQEGEFASIYNELTYRNSIFRNVQIKDPNLKFESSFISISDYNLKMNRNLPFFMCPYDFKLITPIITSKKDAFPYINAKPLFYLDEKFFKDVDHYHKVHKMDDLHLTRLYEYLNLNDIVYECANHELEPTKMHRVISKENYTIKTENISVDYLMTINIDKNEHLFIFNIIKNYLLGTFKLTENVINILNNFYYAQSVENYLFIPIVLYILKKTLEES